MDSISQPALPCFDDASPVDSWRPRNPDGFGLGQDARVLCSDFIWRPAGEIELGDELIAFDEQILAGQRRRMQFATVTARTRVLLPSYRMCFEGGRHLVVGEEHSLLSGSKGGNWTRARYIAAGREVRDLGTPWTVGRSWEHGWLAGAFDGEACFSSRTGKPGGGWFIQFCQNPGAVLDLAEALLKQFGFETRRKSDAGRTVQRLAVTGIYDCFRFLGECRPVRFLEKARPWVEAGSPARTRGTARQRQYNAITASVEYLGQRELVALQTTSRTMLAEGLFVGSGVTHKSRTMPSTMRR